MDRVTHAAAWTTEAIHKALENALCRYKGSMRDHPSTKRLLDIIAAEMASIRVCTEEQDLLAEPILRERLPYELRKADPEPKPVTAERTVAALLKRPTLAHEVLVALRDRLVSPWQRENRQTQFAGLCRLGGRGEEIGRVRITAVAALDGPMWNATVYPNLRGPPPDKTETGCTRETAEEAQQWVDARLTDDGYVLG